MNTFKINDTFTTTCIFTGGTHTNKIVKRDKNQIVCECIYEESDGTHNVTDEYAIYEDDLGEYIILWTYQGEEGRQYAKDL